MPRAMLATFAAFHAGQNPTSPAVLGLTDAEALALVAELDVATLRYPEAVAAGAAALAALPAPPTEADALEAWALGKRAASALLWDALAGEEVDGVTIIRKRTA